METMEDTQIAEQPAASEPTTKPLEIIPAARVKDVRRLSMTAREAHRQLAECQDDPETKAFLIAHSINALQEALTPAMLSDIRRLADSPLGFKTDRPPGAKKDGKALQPYPDIVFRDVIVQALIRGLRITGNEFNVLVGNLYVTKEGYQRLLREYPGLTDLKIQIGVPKTQTGGALVPAKASWRMNGIADELDCFGDYSIAVKVNNAMGVDAIQGKAESKLLRRIHARIAGTELSVPDPDEPGVIDGEVVSGGDDGQADN